MKTWALWGVAALVLAALALAGPVAPGLELGPLVPLGLFGISFGGILKTAGGLLGLGSDDDKANADAIRNAVTELKTSTDAKLHAAELEIERVKAEAAAAENRRLAAALDQQRQAAAMADKQPPWLLIGGALVAVYLVMQVQRKRK